MTRTCALCGTELPGTVGDDEADVILDELRAACRDMEITLLPGDRVRTDDAARLLGVQRRTVEAWRSEGIGPEVTRGARPTYTLAGLAAHIAAQRAKYAGSYGLLPAAT